MLLELNVKLEIRGHWFLPIGTVESVESVESVLRARGRAVDVVRGRGKGRGRVRRCGSVKD